MRISGGGGFRVALSAAGYKQSNARRKIRFATTRLLALSVFRFAAQRPGG
jgi:hypothetical protein